MSPPVCFLDVNVPMYAAGADHPLKAACVWIMQEVADGRLEVAIDTEILQEILHRFGAIGRPTMGITMARALLDLVPVVHPVRVTDARKAIELFEEHAASGVMARDALHAAVMLGNGLDCILSADQHFDRIGGLTRVAVGTLDQTRADLDRLSFPFRN